MLQTEQTKPKNIHIIINIGLIAFLGFVGTIGTLSLGQTNYVTTINKMTNIETSATKKKVMICAIGRCIFV